MENGNKCILSGHSICLISNPKLVYLPILQRYCEEFQYNGRKITWGRPEKTLVRNNKHHFQRHYILSSRGHRAFAPQHISLEELKYGQKFSGSAHRKENWISVWLSVKLSGKATSDFHWYTTALSTAWSEWNHVWVCDVAHLKKSWSDYVSVYSRLRKFFLKVLKKIRPKNVHLWYFIILQFVFSYYDGLFCGMYVSLSVRRRKFLETRYHLNGYIELKFSSFLSLRVIMLTEISKFFSNFHVVCVLKKQFRYPG